MFHPNDVDIGVTAVAAPSFAHCDAIHDLPDEPKEIDQLQNPDHDDVVEARMDLGDTIFTD